MNKYVDAIFVINLRERSDRLIQTIDELQNHGIKFITWVAIKDADGKRGLIKTMKELFHYCLEMDYQRICVFEDDIRILRNNFNELMDKCMSQLPEDFHLFYMGGNVWKEPLRKSENILQVPAIYSTHAIIYSREAMLYIYSNLDEDRPYDITLVKTIQKLNKCYCSFPMLISQRDGFSDIENRNVQYDKFLEKRFKEKTIHLL